MATVAKLKDIVDALIETGLELNSMDRIISDLKLFLEYVSARDDLKGVLATTAFETEERSRVIQDICQAAEMLDETRNFLVLAVELEKFAVLLNTRDVVIRKLEQAAGRLEAEITSAVQLTDEQLGRIRESINRATGKNVEITLTVDPAIMGGLITKIGDRVFDNSIKTQLDNIKGVLSP